MSWRLLGTEETTTTFDIYRDGVKIVSNLDATNYTDNSGFDTNTYKVVVSGESADNEKNICLEHKLFGYSYFKA